jgi:hypothetical protein
LLQTPCAIPPEADARPCGRADCCADRRPRETGRADADKYGTRRRRPADRCTDADRPTCTRTQGGADGRGPRPGSVRDAQSTRRITAQTPRFKSVFGAPKMGPDALLQRLGSPRRESRWQCAAHSQHPPPELQWSPVAGLMGSRTGRFRWAGPVRGSRHSPVEKSTALTARRCAPRRSVTSDAYASDTGTTMHCTNRACGRGPGRRSEPGPEGG